MGLLPPRWGGHAPDSACYEASSVARLEKGVNMRAARVNAGRFFRVILDFTVICSDIKSAVTSGGAPASDCLRRWVAAAAAMGGCGRGAATGPLAGARGVRVGARSGRCGCWRSQQACPGRAPAYAYGRKERGAAMLACGAAGDTVGLQCCLGKDAESDRSAGDAEHPGAPGGA